MSTILDWVKAELAIFRTSSWQEKTARLPQSLARWEGMGVRVVRSPIWPKTWLALSSAAIGLSLGPEFGLLTNGQACFPKNELPGGTRTTDRGFGAL